MSAKKSKFPRFNDEKRPLRSTAQHSYRCHPPRVSITARGSGRRNARRSGPRRRTRPPRAQRSHEAGPTTSRPGAIDDPTGAAAPRSRRSVANGRLRSGSGRGARALVESADVTVWAYCQVVAANTQRTRCSPEEAVWSSVSDGKRMASVRAHTPMSGSGTGATGVSEQAVRVAGPTANRRNRNAVRLFMGSPSDWRDDAGPPASRRHRPGWYTRGAPPAAWDRCGTRRTGVASSICPRTAPGCLGAARCGRRPWPCPHTARRTRDSPESACSPFARGGRNRAWLPRGGTRGKQEPFSQPVPILKEKRRTAEAGSTAYSYRRRGVVSPHTSPNTKKAGSSPEWWRTPAIDRFAM